MRLQISVLALVISIAIVDFVFGHDEAHEKAKYRAEMNKGGVEYDEGDLMDDMRMFGDVKSFLESDTMKQLASNLGKGGLSPESLLSVAGNFLGGNNKPSGKGKDPTASLSDTLDMLTKGAEMLGQIFPPNPNDDDDEENVINVEDDDDLQESVGTKRSGAGAKRGRSDDDPLQAILGQVLQSGPLQNTLMNVVGGLLNQGASESACKVMGREKASGSKSADNPFDGVVDVLLSAAMEHFGNSEGKPLPAADKKQAAESSSSPSSSRRSEAAADADESVPTVGKKVPERKINGTKPTRQVDQEDLFDALKKNGIDIDGVKENLGSVFDTKPEQGQKSNLSSKSAENLKKSSQTQDLISEALLEWAESASTENQKEARRVVVNVIKKALFNFASYGKSMDSSKFMQDLATANFAIKPKIADLIKKYKIDSDFE
ncbi:unnamed protein product, partial [Notodromas monacha]